MLIGAAALALAGCAHRASPRIPAAVKIGTTQKGIASWYGVPYHGRLAASGEIYDMEQFTAAHRSFPFNTWVEVTDLDNGKKVDVRVNDRGPFVRHRIIDLSLAAAREIDMVGPGTARVKLKVIAPPRAFAQAVPQPAPVPAPAAGLYTVQAGAFSTADRAASFAESLREQFPELRVESLGTVWRVLIGRSLPLDQAKQLAEKVRSAAGQAIIVPDP
jgi:rare lipoprotein A